MKFNVFFVDCSFPKDYNSSNLCAIMEKLLSSSFHDSLGLFQLTPKTDGSSDVHRAVPLCDEALSGSKKSEHLFHLSKLFNHMQARLFAWVSQKLSKSPEAPGDADSLEKLIIHCESYSFHFVLLVLHNFN